MPTLIEPRPVTRQRLQLVVDWKPEWFDGARRLFTTAELTEMGFANPERFRVGFLNTAQRIGKWGQSEKSVEGVVVWANSCAPEDRLNRRRGRPRKAAVKDSQPGHPQKTADEDAQPFGEPLLFRRREAAARLGISLRMLDQMHAERQIVATRIRGAVRFSAAELNRIAAEGVQP